MTDLLQGRAGRLAAAGTRSDTGRFVRHFVEMLVAMLLGMAVLMVALTAILALAGSDYMSAEGDAPAALLAAMGVAMTLPMAAWMGHRGLPRAQIAEMVGAMGAVTLAILALLATGVVDADAALGAQHVAMVAAMLAVMLARRRIYSRRAAASDI
jgi:hypothetical protein